jgi:hypothetical protein
VSPQRDQIYSALRKQQRESNVNDMAQFCKHVSTEVQFQVIHISVHISQYENLSVYILRSP